MRRAGTITDTVPHSRKLRHRNAFGTVDKEERITLSLSDSFDGESDIEVMVTIININFGHNKALLDACKPLKEYAWFVDKIRSYQQTMETLEEAVDAVLEELPDNSLIKPFLVANKAEVKRMCITEYDEARTFAEQREEGREEGILAALIGLVKDGILTVAEFEAKTGLKA